MHKVYENDDAMMYLKKRYCHCCGNILTTRNTERIVRKGDPDHFEYCSIGTTYHPYGDILVVGKEYFCQNCKKAFSCGEQGNVIKAQKAHKRRIVSEEEIAAVKAEKASKHLKVIRKLRWTLLIPLIGWLVCLGYISTNSSLNNRMGQHDGKLITGISVAVLLFVALVASIILDSIEATVPADFMQICRNVLMPAVAFWAFNMPMLAYVNKRF